VTEERKLVDRVKRAATSMDIVKVYEIAERALIVRVREQESVMYAYSLLAYADNAQCVRLGTRLRPNACESVEPRHDQAMTHPPPPPAFVGEPTSSKTVPQNLTQNLQGH
jgi:hypothetical protein